MDLILVDDSKQKKPSRPGMGHLVAVGGLHVPSDGVQALARTLDETCKEYGFPSDRDEFKWSPGRRDWMRKNLVEGDRQEFFADCLEAAKEEGAEAFVVIEDKSRRSTEAATTITKWPQSRSSWSGAITTCAAAVRKPW
jgi:hypothetical protein